MLAYHVAQQKSNWQVQNCSTHAFCCTSVLFTVCDAICRRVVFQPYTRQQLETIAKTRLEGLDVFEGRAIEYAARKVISNTACQNVVLLRIIWYQACPICDLQSWLCLKERLYALAKSSHELLWVSRCMLYAVDTMSFWLFAFWQTLTCRRPKHHSVKQCLPCPVTH